MYSYDIAFNLDADVMKGIICLHALVLSFDAIIHYGIPTAVGSYIW